MGVQEWLIGQGFNDEGFDVFCKLVPCVDGIPLELGFMLFRGEWLGFLTQMGRKDHVAITARSFKTIEDCRQLMEVVGLRVV